MLIANFELPNISVQVVTMIFHQLCEMFEAQHVARNHGILFPRKDRWYSSWDLNPEPSV